MGSYLATLRRFFLISPPPPAEEKDDSAINTQEALDLKLKAIIDSYYFTFIPAIKSDLAVIHRRLNAFRFCVARIPHYLNHNDAKTAIIAELKLMLIPPVLLSTALADTMCQHRFHPLMNSMFRMRPSWKIEQGLKVFRILQEGRSLMTSKFSCIRCNLITTLSEATDCIEMLEEPALLMLPEIEKTIEEIESSVTKFSEKLNVYRSEFNYFETEFERMIWE